MQQDLRKKYYKILEGKYKGFIGRCDGVMGGFIVILIQRYNQWFYCYERESNLIEIKKYTIYSSNNTNYVREF